MVDSLSTFRFLSASTPKGLERQMLKNNLARRAWHNYQIVFDGRKWYAWYQVDLSGAYNREIEEIKSAEPTGG